MEKTDNIKLTYCDLGVAYQCNFQCKMCKFWENSPLNQNNVLSIEQWRDVLEQLSALVDKKNCIINLSGPGEPLLRNNILDLIKHGVDLGLKIQIISNGFCLNNQIAADIAASKLKFISFSLDSLNPETHNYLRGKDNAFEHVMQAIDNIALICPDICIGINTVISKVNLNEIIELTQWVQNDKRLAYINFQAIAQPFSYDQAENVEWFKQLEYKELWPDDKKAIEQVIDQLIEFKQKGYKLADGIVQFEVFKQYFLDPLTFIKKTKCNVAKAGILNIDPVGNIAKCQMIGIIDNIKNGKTLKQICLSEKAEEHTALINNCQRNCHLVVSCHFDNE